MESVDPAMAMVVFVIMASVASMVMNIIRTIHAVKPQPSNESSLQKISARLDAMENRQRATEERLTRHEDKLSSQIKALHERINEVFGELREIKGSIKQHLKQGE